MLGDILQSGSNFKDAVVRALRRLDEELTQLRLVSGRGIRLRRTAAGTVIEAAGGVQTSCNTLPAAAPAGSVYTGPFAVSYDKESGKIVMDAGWADTIGQVVQVPRQMFDGPYAVYPFTRIYIDFYWDSQNNEIAYSFAAMPSSSNDSSNEGGSAIEYERVFIAMIQYLSDGVYTISQWQHGPIRISGRAW